MKYFNNDTSLKLSNTQEKLIWNTTESFDFKNISNILFVLQLISKKQHDILFSLNSLRNQIIHKYFYDPFEKDYHGISKTKFHSIFKSAYNLSWKISELNEKMYSIESLTSVKRNKRIPLLTTAAGKSKATAVLSSQA